MKLNKKLSEISLEKETMKLAYDNTSEQLKNY